eukprot:2321507-Ditylum_brightwellii.AAC.1
MRGIRGGCGIVFIPLSVPPAVFLTWEVLDLHCQRAPKMSRLASMTRMYPTKPGSPTAVELFPNKDMAQSQACHQK